MLRPRQVRVIPFAASFTLVWGGSSRLALSSRLPGVVDPAAPPQAAQSLCTRPVSPPKARGRTSRVAQLSACMGLESWGTKKDALRSTKDNIIKQQIRDTNLGGAGVLLSYCLSSLSLSNYFLATPIAAATKPLDRCTRNLACT